MPAKYRLSRADFQNMRAFKRVPGSFFSLSYGTIPGRTASGAACIVSTKAAVRAVDRNTIKRRVRALLVDFVKTAPSPVVVIVHAKKAAAEASFADIQKELGNLFSKVNL